MPAWVTKLEEPHTLDPIEPTSMAPSTMRGYSTWWAMIRPTPLGMEEYDEEEDMVVSLLEESFYEDENMEKIHISQYQG